MIADLARHRDELVRLCRHFGVRRLDVFGSAVHGQFDPARSDLDFLVEFDPTAGMSLFDAYFGLKEALEGAVRPAGRPRVAPRARQPLLRRGRRAHP